MYVESVKDEIQLAEDECCIVFDFGCYFPYVNREVLTFDFSLGEETFDDYKINHRYPNKRYCTISKKFGRKVSKIGYSYIFKLNEQNLFRLTVRVGINKQCLTLIFPIRTNLSKEKPICGLTLHYDFDTAKFSFITYENANSGWYQHIWRNHELENETNVDNVTILSPCKVYEENYTIVFDGCIELFPSVLSDLML